VVTSDIQSANSRKVFVCTSNQGKARELRAALAGPAVFGLGDLSAAQRERFIEPVEDGETFCLNGMKKLVAALRVFVDDQGRLVQQSASDLCPDIVVVDDSGLCVPALGFEPGVHSAYFAGTPRDDRRNLQRLAALAAAQGEASSFVPGERRLHAFFACSLLAFDLRQLLARRDERLRLQIITKLGDLAASVEGSDIARPSWETGIFEAARAHKGAGVCPELNIFGDKDGVNYNLVKVCYGFSWGAVSSVEQELLPGEGHGYDPIFYPDAQPTHSFASISLEQKNEWSHRGQAAKLLRAAIMK
jgi:inosine/xanthosine triphosphate pyrophosphatase family protein